LKDLLGFYSDVLKGANRPVQFYNTSGSVFGLHIDPYNFGTVNTMLNGSSKLWVLPSTKNMDVIQNYLREHVDPSKTSDRIENCEQFWSHPYYIFDPWIVAKALSKSNSVPIHEYYSFILP